VWNRNTHKDANETCNQHGIQGHEALCVDFVAPIIVLLKRSFGEFPNDYGKNGKRETGQRIKSLNQIKNNFKKNDRARRDRFFFGETCWPGLKTGSTKGAMGVVVLAMVLPFVVATFACLGILWIVSHASIVLTVVLGVFFFIIYVVGAWCAWQTGSFEAGEEDGDESHPQSGDEQQEWKGD
jgi:hypothetical protein